MTAEPFDNDLLFTQEDADAIHPNDKNVELYGMITTVNAPVTVGRTGRQFEVMKFMISNRNNVDIQCSIWGADIELHRANIQAGSIVHINGAWAVETPTHYNKGTVPFELSMKATTIIEVEQKNVPDDEIVADPTAIALEQIGEFVGEFVVTQGFLKSPFQVVAARDPYGTSTLCTGGEVEQADRSERIDMRVNKFVANDDFAVGMHIEIRGIPRQERDRFGTLRMHLEVNGMAAMRIASDDTRTSRQMVKCRRYAVRR